MIRLVATGVWICLVTVVSTFAATFWHSDSSAEVPGERLFGGLQSMQTNVISVPVVSDGALQGYALAKFTFTMKSDVFKKMSVKPDVFLLDSAFRAIYVTDASALRGAKKQDLQSLTAGIKKRVNERFGQEFVEDVLIESFNYVPKNEVRNGSSVSKVRPE